MKKLARRTAIKTKQQTTLRDQTNTKQTSLRVAI
jgi:hypothetical protein